MNNETRTFEDCLKQAHYFEARAYRSNDGDLAARQAARYYEAAMIAKRFQFVSWVAGKWQGWNSKL